jgi:thiol:disulfide interchange protein
MVKQVSTKKEFDSIIGQSKLVVVDFTATWCAALEAQA